MTREEQLVYCKKCTNRKMDFQQGLVCGLTGQKAAFINECPNFLLDESAVASREKVLLSSGDTLAAVPSKVYDRLRSEQDLLRGFWPSVGLGLLGAVLWGLITVSTGYQIGYMPLAIGAGVGLSMRYFGRGVDMIFGVYGALISLMSCVLGNALSIIGFVANYEGLGYVETLLVFNYGVLPEILIESQTAMDLLFYGIAVFQGYRISFRVVSDAEIQELSER